MANKKVRIVGSSLDKNKEDIWKAYGRDIPEGRNCSIKGCTQKATVGGHVWVELEGYREHCYIVPICEKHATNSKLHFPDPLKINANVSPKKGNLKRECKCSNELIPGEVYCGQYKVLNVGSSLDRRKEPDIWEQYQSQHIHQHQTCTIRGCRGRAAKGGHVWVKEREDSCFILPLCTECAEPQKLKPNYPNNMYKLTNVYVNIMVGNKKEKCKCNDRLIPGEVYCGQYSVTNVQGSCIDPGNKSEDWKKWTGLDIPKRCQLSHCNEVQNVIDGAHMWVGRRRDFCFILPLCIDHNRPNGAKYFHHPDYKNTLTTARLVVRKPGEKCGIHYLGGCEDDCDDCKRL